MRSQWLLVTKMMELVMKIITMMMMISPTLQKKYEDDVGSDQLSSDTKTFSSCHRINKAHYLVTLLSLCSLFSTSSSNG